jgi:hypothetical protein
MMAPEQRFENHCPGVLNQSNIHFTNKEIQLLEKGIKYNLHQKPKTGLALPLLKLELQEVI